MTYVGKKPADIIATAVDTTTGTFSGDLTVDTNTLYVDSANNRVGINETVPFAKLHISDTQTGRTSAGSTGDLLVLEDDNNGMSIISSNSGQGHILFGDVDDGAAGAIAYDHSSDNLRFRTNSTWDRMILDSSGNLLVGKTAESGNTAGHFFSPSGYQRSTRNGGIHIMNRITTDGSIIDFQKDGSAVGSIGVNAGRLYIGSTAGNDSFITFTGDEIYPATSTGGGRDDAINLGTSGARFKDLYLSGGVYLGGTGSANKLDDYEEGTWTPAYSTSGGSFSYDGATEGIYTKIGNVVSVSFRIYTTNATIGSGNVSITGLPFTPTSTHKGAGSIGDCRLFAGDHPSTLSIQANGVVQPYYRASANGSNSALQASELQSGTGTYNLIDGQITYQTS